MKKTKGKIKGVITPYKILGREDISSNAKLVFALLLEMNSWSNPDGTYTKGAWPTNATIQKILGIKSNKTISNAIDALVDKNLIKIRYKNGGKKRICYIMGDCKNYNDDLVKITTDRVYSTIYSTTYCNSPNTSFRLSEKGRVVSPENTAMEKQPAKPKPHPLVEYWNSLPLAKPKHRLGTKAYSNAVYMIRRLQKGKIGQDRFPVSEESIKRHKIKRQIGQTWTDEQIKAWMAKMAKMQQADYWPENKSILPKTLSDAIYNPRTGFSWALAYKFNQPKKLNQKIAANLSDEVRPTYDLLLKTLESRSTVSKRPDLDTICINAAYALLRYIDKVRKILPPAQGSVSDPFNIVRFRLITDYCEYWEERVGDPRYVGPQAKHWWQFENEFSEKIGYDLRTGKELEI